MPTVRGVPARRRWTGGASEGPSVRCQLPGSIALQRDPPRPDRSCFPSELLLQSGFALSETLNGFHLDFKNIDVWGAVFSSVWHIRLLTLASGWADLRPGDPSVT